MMEHLRRGLYAWLALSLMLGAPAEAYIDPGSGSFILQMLLAGLLGLGMTIKLYWRRLVAFFGKRKQTSDDDAS